MMNSISETNHYDLLAQYKDVFSILNLSLFPLNQETDSFSIDSDWDQIYKELKEQAVSTLTYPWLKTHKLPNPEIQQKWITSCLQQQARWIQVMHEQTKLINLLEHHAIPCVIIKGAAAMMSYPQPTLRAVGDIDFLVKRADYDKAASILENNGYRLTKEKHPEAHHYEYVKDGVEFELHKRLWIIKETNEELLSLFESGIDNRVWHTIANTKFPTLPDNLNGLVLLFHINQHLVEGIGLRQIVDWMMYINTNNLDNILPIAKATGMEKLALTSTSICQKYLGLPQIIEESEALPTDRLMEYIMSKGNLGRKAGLEGRISSFSTTTTNPILIFRRLQKSGLGTWEAAKKHKILRPFAWIYRIGCVFKEIINNKLSFKKMIKSHKLGSGQRDLIHDLGLDYDNQSQGTH